MAAQDLMAWVSQFLASQKLP